MINKQDMDECQALIQLLIEKYEQILSNCNKDIVHELELIYLKRKLDTVKKAMPEGYKPSDEMKRQDAINRITQKIKQRIIEYYGIETDDIEKFIKDDSEGLHIIEQFKKECTEIAKRTIKRLNTIIPTRGVTRLNASKNRENQYYNEIINGIFATSDYDETISYTIRAACSPKGMIKRGNEIRYPDNPFIIEENSDFVLLKNPVSAYLTDVSYFEPSIDFVIENGSPKILFDSEWVAKVDGLDAEEERIDRVPKEFFTRYKVYTRGSNEPIKINNKEK